jgi:predicted nucleic acid-binding protein
MTEMRIYFDTCMAIYFVERSLPAREQSITAALQERRARQPLLCWTDLTRLECRVKPLREQDHELLASYEQFFSQSRALYLPMTAKDFGIATELRARHRLKTPDALHLAAAISAGCDEFWTNDHRLDSAAAGHLRTVTL